MSGHVAIPVPKCPSFSENVLLTVAASWYSLIALSLSGFAGGTHLGRRRCRVGSSGDPEIVQIPGTDGKLARILPRCSETYSRLRVQRMHITQFSTYALDMFVIILQNAVWHPRVL